MTRRRLSEDEHALWKGVTRSIAPLRKRPKLEPSDADGTPALPVAKASAKSRAEARSKAAADAAVAPKKPEKPPALAPLGRKLKQRIARGSHAIDGRLDLHGMTQAEAHDALFRFLRAKQARGDKLVLVITGKGIRGSDDTGGRGVLKRMVPLWLQLAEFRDLVVGFEGAAIGHGGEGALYVRLRRAP